MYLDSCTNYICTAPTGTAARASGHSCYELRHVPSKHTSASSTTTTTTTTPPHDHRHDTPRPIPPPKAPTPHDRHYAHETTHLPAGSNTTPVSRGRAPGGSDVELRPVYPPGPHNLKHWGFYMPFGNRPKGSPTTTHHTHTHTTHAHCTHHRNRPHPPPHTPGSRVSFLVSPRIPGRLSSGVARAARCTAAVEKKARVRQNTPRRDVTTPCLRSYHSHASRYALLLPVIQHTFCCYPPG